MGEVWLAEQTEPVRRRVAVKVIKAGLDTAAVVARFEAERQALAVMDHAAIAKVFDAGSTAQGRPYFAMEYVRGECITDYCDRHRLSIPERLVLFSQVCEGVQHAHQKGIIHRDLKPSNILVTSQDDRPVAKIIDFGVSKATSSELTNRTLYTAFGGFIGTPEYMSPEQAELGATDVDTRSDIYALGVVLYELLTGFLPFDHEMFSRRGLDDVRRTIREIDPPRPSTRVSQLRPVPDDAAVRRRTEPSRLVACLRGDLDWVVMKALEKDRTKRYQTANAFALDLKRHLADEPVSAGPPSAGYRVRKFVRRHRLAVTGAAVLILLLVAFSVVALLQAARIARERDRANREAQTTQHVLSFLIGLFNISDPSEARGATLTAREILEKGSRDVDITLAREPEVQARIQATMGSVYNSLGLYRDAMTQLERAVATQRRLFGDTHPETLRTASKLADAYWYQKRFDDAERLYRQIAHERMRVLGTEHPETLRANFDLASTFLLKRQWQEAEELISKTLAIQRRVLGERHNDTLSSMNVLQGLYFQQKRYPEALPVAEAVREGFIAIHGREHPYSLQAGHNVATIYENLDRQADAERLYLETSELNTRILGAAHPETIGTQIALAKFYEKLGRFDQAEQVARLAYDMVSASAGEHNPQAQSAIRGLVSIYERWDKPEAAARWRLKLSPRPTPAKAANPSSPDSVR